MCATCLLSSGFDDHDLHFRAYHQKGWITGHIPVDYTEDRTRKKGYERAGGAVAQDMKRLHGEAVAWWKRRRAQSPLNVNSRWNKTSNTHDEFRLIDDPDWHPSCNLIKAPKVPLPA